MVRQIGVIACLLSLSLGCGDAGPNGAAGTSAGAAGDTSNPTSTTGDSGGSTVGGATLAPFDDLTRLPDVDTAPVADCAGQPDLTLCGVVTEPDRSYDICVGGECVSPGCGDTSCNSPAPHFTIPPMSHHDYFERVPGEEPVVVDLVTGLHWQGCVAGRSGEACETGTLEQFTWDAALAYCDGLSWGGQDDWYLPDAYELLSIVDFAKGSPSNNGIALDETLFPNPSSQVWTSHYATDTYVHQLQLFGPSLFANPTTMRDRRSDDNSVRCARRGFSRDAGYTEQRFYPTAPGPEAEKVIEDVATGLLWQGCVAGHTGWRCDQGSTLQLTVPEWAPHCEALSWAGFSDWRLPTFKELHSIAQYPPTPNAYDAEIDAEVFDVDGIGPYLASTSSWGDDAVFMLFDIEGANKTGPTGDYPVLCVRWASP